MLRVLLRLKFKLEMPWNMLWKFLRELPREALIPVAVEGKNKVLALRDSLACSDIRPFSPDPAVNKATFGQGYLWPMLKMLKTIMLSPVQRFYAEEPRIGPGVYADCAGATFENEQERLMALYGAMYTRLDVVCGDNYATARTSLLSRAADPSITLFNTPLMLGMHIDGKSLFATEGLVLGFVSQYNLGGDSPLWRMPWFIAKGDEKRELLSSIGGEAFEDVSSLVDFGLEWTAGDTAWWAPVVVVCVSDLKCTHTLLGVQGGSATYGCHLCDGQVGKGAGNTGDLREYNALYTRSAKVAKVYANWRKKNPLRATSKFATSTVRKAIVADRKSVV